MQGKGNNICDKCKQKIKWNQDKYRLVQERYFPKEERGETRNMKMWHIKCWEELFLSSERREKN